jgi:hypothetical protein
MRLRSCIVLAAAVVLSCSPMIAAQLHEGADASCDVTPANGVSPPSAHLDQFIGNSRLAVSHYGTVVFRPGGPGFLTRNGSLVMKFGWALSTTGKLLITGRRLDREASALGAHISHSEDPLFTPSYLIFATPGCWEVNARIDGVEDSSLTFITRVVKVGDGPTGRWNPAN